MAKMRDIVLAGVALASISMAAPNSGAEAFQFPPVAGTPYIGITHNAYPTFDIDITARTAATDDSIELFPETARVKPAIFKVFPEGRRILPVGFNPYRHRFARGLFVSPLQNVPETGSIWMLLLSMVGIFGATLIRPRLLRL